MLKELAAAAAGAAVVKRQTRLSTAAPTASAYQRKHITLMVRKCMCTIFIHDFNLLSLTFYDRFFFFFLILVFFPFHLYLRLALCVDPNCRFFFFFFNFIFLHQIKLVFYWNIVWNKVVNDWLTDWLYIVYTIHYTGMGNTHGYFCTYCWTSFV